MGNYCLRCEDLRHDLAVVNGKADKAQEERAELVRVVEIIAEHLGIDVDELIENPDLALVIGKVTP